MPLKVLYISSPSFLDLDLSFVKAMSGKVDLYFLFDLYPDLVKATALDIDRVFDRPSIRPAADYPGLTIYSDFLDIDRTFVINRTRKAWYSWTNFLLQWQTRRFVTQLDPDIVHFNNHVYFNHFYLFARNRRRILINVHDPFPHSGERLTVKARIQRWTNNRLIGNHVLFNQALRDEYVEKNRLHGTRIISSSLGVYEYLSALASDDPSELGSDLLFFGRISPYKGLEDLLAAFRLVIERQPDARLIIAGAGSFWFDVDSFGIPDRNLIIMNRYISTRELATLIRNTRLVVCPYTDATQSGVIMSAYALCKPVVATRVGGLGEMVEDQHTGVLVEPRNPAQLADTLIGLLGDDKRLEAMRQAIDASYFRGEKSWDAIATAMATVYHELAGR